METEDQESCNVYGLNIHGSVVTYYPNYIFDSENNITEDQTSADEIVYYVDQANNDEKIKAIIVEIDSYGGSPVGGEEMMKAFKHSKKPVVAFIRDVGTSAAYLAATGAQTIFASRFSDVGSIGITYSYLDYSEKNRKEGVKFIELNSGKFKDTGNPDKPLSQEELALYQRDIKIARDYFIQMVAENRKLGIAEVSKLADGSTLMGDSALRAGLVDRIGSFYDARELIKEKIGSEVELCWKN
ncbi:MAG: putative signal peptide peptidase SppA [Parcubacteria group bacterium ADurb.Bin326]|nr:MAG: putative signal peptide peptidase SppA [Parcubacteria group bacterium ADurb.Bin326]